MKFGSLVSVTNFIQKFFRKINFGHFKNVHFRKSEKSFEKGPLVRGLLLRCSKNLKKKIKMCYDKIFKKIKKGFKSFFGWIHYGYIGYKKRAKNEHEFLV